MIENRTIFQGDVLKKLSKFDDESVDVVISSPPYWGLRDYGVDGQLGLEPDFRDYLKTMSKIMNQIKRVLKSTGTCWINLGDTYNTVCGGMKDVLKTKSRIGIPERFYINCIDEGWIARNHIVWTKNNSMPSSVQDRFTNKWESVFFFSKNKKYYFDLDAVRVPTITKNNIPFNVRVRDSEKKRFLQKASLDEIQSHNKKGERKSLNVKGQSPQGIHRKRHSGYFGANGEYLCNPKGKNPGDIFQINTRPFKEAHFATFPPDLPEKILRCSCPKDGIVLDPFFGSGTVGLVAEKLGLRWCGIELNPNYVELAKKRIFTKLNSKIEVFG
jgi:DNA modification methylase